MERIFNYLKPYIIDNNANYCNGKLNINLIIGVKYLIVKRDDIDDKIFIGLPFHHHDDCDYRCASPCINSTRKYKNLHYNVHYFELVPDFNFSYVSDIILTFYSFNNINYDISYYPVLRYYIYIVKTKYHIYITNSFKYNQQLFNNNNYNLPSSFLNCFYQSMLIDKIHDILLIN